eukprot:GEMP01110301.1.p1 GENE.GEMP01110301.1~~GEMP01110301.1.p1  ORF type:complete len:105 (-),score=11.55 GEMP01110301.1:114-428(-)
MEPSVRKQIVQNNQNIIRATYNFVHYIALKMVMQLRDEQCQEVICQEWVIWVLTNERIRYIIDLFPHHSSESSFRKRSLHSEFSVWNKCSSRIRRMMVCWRVFF